MVPLLQGVPHAAVSGPDTATSRKNAGASTARGPVRRGGQAAGTQVDLLLATRAAHCAEQT